MNKNKDLILALQKRMKIKDISSQERKVCEDLLEELTGKTEKVSFSLTVWLGDRVFNHQEVKINKKLLGNHELVTGTHWMTHAQNILKIIEEEHKSES